jgi:hypothetical protein
VTATPTANPTQFSVSGQITAYSAAAAAGHGVGAIVASGQDVASTGGGAQTTVISSFTPAASGLYEVTGTISCTTGDTVTVTVTWTDAVNTTAQTRTVLAAVAVGANGSAEFEATCRANTATNPSVQITVSSQASTKGSAIWRRLQ